MQKLFLFLFFVVINIWTISGRENNFIYDYIVIGTGPGGSSVAGRLAQIGKSVLVLERGINISNLEGEFLYYRAPRYTDTTLDVSAAAKFYVEHRNVYAGRREIEFVQGMDLGGSTAINGLVAVRGAKVLFDEWKDSFGLLDFGYYGLLPYFIRSENNSRANPNNPGIFGNKGPVPLTDEPTLGVYAAAFQQSMAATKIHNIPYNPDISISASLIGVGSPQKVVNRLRRRVLASEAYLDPLLESGYLTVLSGVLVTRIIFDHSGSRALGVEALVKDKFHTFRLKDNGEVILSAGAVESPKLLMVSGIGPQDALEAVGITPIKIVDGIGRNLQDQPGAVTVNIGFIVEPYNSFPTLYPPASVIAQYLKNGTGDLAHSSNPVTSFYSSGLNGDHIDTNMQISDCVPAYSPLPSSGYALACFNVREISRGRILLRTASAFNEPEIIGNYFENQTDVNVLAECLRLAHIMATDVTTSSLANLTLSVVDPPLSADEWNLPIPELYAVLDPYIRASGSTGYHLGGTVALGSVLNEKFQIPGISGLRVVDLSIEPRVVSNNPQLSVYALGEKAAVSIKKDIYKHKHYRYLLQVSSQCEGKWEVSNRNSQEAVFDWDATLSDAIIARGQFSVGGQQKETIYTDPGTGVKLSIYLYGIFQSSSISSC